jgi:hypothetical protein
MRADIVLDWKDGKMVGLESLGPCLASPCRSAGAGHPLEAVGGQFAERDFRPQAGKVRFPVEPRDAQGARPEISRPRLCWRLYGGVRHILLMRTL